MNENWILEDFEVSSDNESCYSDQIDSDIEAELYSFIHHDLNNNPVQSLNNSSLTENNSVLSQNNIVSPQSSSAISQDKSIPPLNNSAVVQDKSVPPQNNSVSPKENSAPSQNNCIPLQINSVVKKSNQNCGNLIKKNSTNALNVNSFFSDKIPNTNLYYSFETPPIRCATQVKTPLSESPKIHHTNKSIKRKSDVVSEVLGNIQVTFNTKLPSNHFVNRFSNKKNTNPNDTFSKSSDNSLVIVSETSDSDSSVIYTEPDNLEIQMNLSHDTILLSSDGDDSDSSSDRMLFKSCRNKSSPSPNLGPGANLKDPWYIIADDLYRSKKHASRYHERATLTCTNCNLKGHNARFCSVPKAIKCFICGGDHLGYRCKHRVCHKCLQKGHDGKNCYRQVVPICLLCNMRGHNKKDCPDLWRRYHLTTSNDGNIIKRKPNGLNTPIFCYNCGFAGHYGPTCKEPRMDRWCFPTWTSVISYQNPSNILQTQVERNRKWEFVHNKKIFSARENPRANATETRPTPKRRKKKKKNTPKKAPNVESKKKRNTPKSAPAVESKSKVSNDVYFPRTPKIPQNDKASKRVDPTRRQLQRWKSVENRLRIKQQRHQMDLQRRLGLPFPPTI